MTELRASLGWSYPAAQAVIPAMSAASIAQVRRLTDMVLKLPQYPFKTKHRLHAGIYSRTVTIPPQPEGASVVTGVLVKNATQLFIYGDDVDVYMGEGEEPRKVRGHEVFLGSPGRKQAFLSRGAFTMTMCFATKAKTVAEAEAEFTDEIELLCPLSETDRHDIVVSEE